MFEYAEKLITGIYKSFVDAPFWSNAVKFLLFIWLFFQGIHTYIYCILALVMIDVITGIYASRIKKEAFKSRRLRKGLIEKVVIYNLLLISVFVLELVIKTGINYEAFYMVLFSTILICTYELTSIMENILVIDPSLKFIRKLIRLTKKIEDRAVEMAEDKVEGVTKD